MKKTVLNRVCRTWLSTIFSVCPTLQQDAELLAKQSAQRAVMLFYDEEPDEVINFFLFCTSYAQIDANNPAPSHQVIHVYGNGHAEERILKKAINKAVNEVSISVVDIRMEQEELILY